MSFLLIIHLISFVVLVQVAVRHYIIKAHSIVKKMEEYNLITNDILRLDMSCQFHSKNYEKAIEIYNNTPGLPNLAPAPVGTENIDAISRKGDRYSIKSTSNATTGVFYGLEEAESDVPDRQKFEYVIVCKFDDDYELQAVLEMDWDKFLRNKRWHSRMHAWNLSLTKKLCQQCKIVYKKEE